MFHETADKTEKRPLYIQLCNASSGIKIKNKNKIKKSAQTWLLDTESRVRAVFGHLEQVFS